MTMRCVVMSGMIVFVVATMCRMCLVVVCVIMLVVMRVTLLAPTSRKEQHSREAYKRFKFSVHLSLSYTIIMRKQRYKNIFATELQRCLL